MQSKLNPYIEFNGRAREAMEFYHSVFGGQLDVSTYKDFQSSPDPSMDEKIMHARLEADNGITLMAADAMDSANYQSGGAFSISLSGDNHAELAGYYEKLSQGGTIIEPLVQAPWGDTFGMLNDKFGVKWMVNITAQSE
jgi:PhnB protein